MKTPFFFSSFCFWRDSGKMESSDMKFKCQNSSVLTMFFCGSVFFSLVACAQNPVSMMKFQPVNIADINVSKHEIAVMQILDEMCPRMLGNDQQKRRFYKAYDAQLRVLLPNLDDPKNLIQYLSTQQDYQTILHNMREWTDTFSYAENQALCEDMANSAM